MKSVEGVSSAWWKSALGLTSEQRNREEWRSGVQSCRPPAPRDTLSQEEAAMALGSLGSMEKPQVQRGGSGSPTKVEP